jgi:hypothetical protein
VLALPLIEEFRLRAERICFASERSMDHGDEFLRGLRSSSEEDALLAALSCGVVSEEALETIWRLEK